MRTADQAKSKRPSRTPAADPAAATAARPRRSQAGAAAATPARQADRKPTTSEQAAAARQQALMAVGEFIRAQRKLAQLSLRDLAEKARVSNPYLSQLERGMYQPSAHVLRSIAGALGLNPGMMFTLAGFLDDESQERSQPSVEQAISLDPRLSTEQKRALITIYRSFLAGTG